MFSYLCKKFMQSIENKMTEISNSSLPINREEIDKDRALEFFEKLNETYKIEIISQIDSDDTISAYSQGKFMDLCRGPHLPNTNKIKFFKLLSCAGAYWRGDEKNKMLQRIYGTSWFSKNALNDYFSLSLIAH